MHTLLENCVDAKMRHAIERKAPYSTLIFCMYLSLTAMLRIVKCTDGFLQGMKKPSITNCRRILNALVCCVMQQNQGDGKLLATCAHGTIKSRINNFNGVLRQKRGWCCRKKGKRKPKVWRMHWKAKKMKILCRVFHQECVQKGNVFPIINTSLFYTYRNNKPKGMCNGLLLVPTHFFFTILIHDL